MKRKTVAIAGASGMIGTYLSTYLQRHEIIRIFRQDLSLENREFIKKYGRADVLINMIGAPISRRWTKQYKQEILASRINSTRKLGSIIKHDPTRNRLYVSASAIGIYNDMEVHTEKSEKYGTGFITEVVQAWENEVYKLGSEETKICILRTGVVLSDAGGMLARLIPVFRLGIGARIGTGNQYLSWIHIEDLARAVDFIIEHDCNGIYNLTAPGYCTNREFTALLAGRLKMPAVLAIPKFVFKIIYGQGAEVVTGGQAVVPQRLINEGFRFRYPEVEKALEDIVN
jgi:uncharacterized protein (TIGR01777 family)